MTVIDCDLCVIGAGSGGLSVAAAAAAFGVKVVLVERALMGGDCLNTGCVPSKALIAAAHHMHATGRAAEFGIDVKGRSVDFSRLHDHIHVVIARIAPVDSQERFEKLGVTVLRHEARFISPEAVMAGDQEIRARRFVVATGSRAAVPPIEGLASVPYLTNETLFDLKELPRHLIVLGAGAIGCEMAQAFVRLGSAVTIVEAAKPLAQEDEEAAALVIEALRRDGVVLAQGVKVMRALRGPEGIELAISGPEGVPHRISGSHLLIAAGRRAVTDGLALDAGAIAVTARGIDVDESLRSRSNRRVYAVGDVAGGPQFTHAANYHAGLVVRSAIFRLPVKVEPQAIPRAIYTDPELAQAGLTERQARQIHRDIRIVESSFHDNDRAITERDTHGFLKVITTKGGRVLGATIVGRGAGDLAGHWQLAISRKMNIRSFAATVYPYPTRAEVSRRAAINFFAASLGSPWLRLLVGILRRFG